MTDALSIDGKVTVGQLPPDGCCPPSICNLSLSAMICDFIHQLPTGPLWDRAKRQAHEFYHSVNPNRTTPPFFCNIVVAHAVYTANRLWDALMDALWPAIRESDPFTAFDTIDDWLDRFGWRDCFAGVCRSIELGPLTPLEVMGPCGCAEYCPPEFPAELVAAVKMGTLHALAILDMGLGGNLDSINAAIAPLGCILRPLGLEAYDRTDGSCPPDTDCDLTVANPLAGVLDPCCPRSARPAFQLCYTCDTLPVPQRFRCDLFDGNAQQPRTVLAYFDTPLTCADGNSRPTARIWPGMLAAECIVRSILNGRPFALTRCI